MIMSLVSKAGKMRFTLRGQEFDVSSTDVIDAAKSIAPGRIQKYSIVIEEMRYPIRQILSLITGLRPIEITSQDAYRILSKLGFTIDTH
jgi:hypothetical protein